MKGPSTKVDLQEGEWLCQAIAESIALQDVILSSPTYKDSVARAIAALVDCFQRNNKVLTFGNGGSSSDAQHVAAEFVGRFQMNRRALPAVALSADSSIITAWSNDFSFDTVFSRQVEAVGNAGDIAWGLSTSGDSRNVVAALKAAKSRGLGTIAMTGSTGGAAADYADILIAVPSRATPRIQEIHVITYHAICKGVEELLFHKPPARKC